jgi:CheY-like chemotaxis protein
MRPIKILVIEDDLDLLRRLTHGLEEAGYSTAAAVDGRDGLKRFTAFAPDIVVIDLIMPDRDGIETILAMRDSRDDVRIVAMSGGVRGRPGTTGRPARDGASSRRRRDDRQAVPVRRPYGAAAGRAARARDLAGGR